MLESLSSTAFNSLDVMWIWFSGFSELERIPPERERMTSSIIFSARLRFEPESVSTPLYMTFPTSFGVKNSPSFSSTSKVGSSERERMPRREAISLRREPILPATLRAAAETRSRPEVVVAGTPRSSVTA